MSMWAEGSTAAGFAPACSSAAASTASCTWGSLAPVRRICWPIVKAVPASTVATTARGSQRRRKVTTMGGGDNERGASLVIGDAGSAHAEDARDLVEGRGVGEHAVDLQPAGKELGDDAPSDGVDVDRHAEGADGQVGEHHHRVGVGSDR